MCFFMSGYCIGHRGLSILTQHTSKGEGGGVYSIVLYFLPYCDYTLFLSISRCVHVFSFLDITILVLGHNAGEVKICD